MPPPNRPTGQCTRRLSSAPGSRPKTARWPGVSFGIWFGVPGPGEVGRVAQEFMPLPSIPVSAGALFFDRAGRLLILKPTYKSGWTIPGGVMEANGETPWDACRREVTEECGLHIGAGHPARLACMDFRRPRPGRPGGIRYVFDCEAFSDAILARDRGTA